MTASLMVGPAAPLSRQGHDRTPERFQALETLWRESKHSSVLRCGREALRGGHVAVKASGTAGAGRAVGFAGLFRCGSVWACPECSAKIANARKSELQAALLEARRRGWTVAHVTLTMRHHDGQDLLSLFTAVSYAWGAVTSGKAWVSQQRVFGVQGWVRLIEVTHGKNGWHVHVHSLVFTAAAGQGRSPRHLAEPMFQRWAKALKRKTLRAPSAKSGGLHVRVLGGTEDLSDYFTKNTYSVAEDRDLEAVALEAARGDLKNGRHGNRAPFEILADLVRDGDARDLDLWHEWEAGSKNRRQMTWSRDLRALLVLEPEKSDQDIAEADQGGDLLLILPADTWTAVCREWGARATLRGLALADNDGTALRAYLRHRGWAWLEPHQAAPVDVGALASKRGV